MNKSNLIAAIPKIPQALLPRMLEEHELLVGALRRLATAAKREKKSDAAPLVGQPGRARSGNQPRRAPRPPDPPLPGPPPGAAVARAAGAVPRATGSAP